MPLNLKSFRPIAHASIMRKAPAFSLRASRLSPTTLHPLNQRSLSNVQKKAPKAETIAQESVASRTRQRYRITPMSVRLAYQQRLKNVAATAYRDGETAGIRFGGHISRSKFILLFDRFFWPAFSGAVCALYICVSSNSSQVESSSETNDSQDGNTENDTDEESVHSYPAIIPPRKSPDL